MLPPPRHLICKSDCPSSSSVRSLSQQICTFSYGSCDLLIVGRSLLLTRYRWFPITTTLLGGSHPRQVIANLPHQPWHQLLLLFFYCASSPFITLNYNRSCKRYWTSSTNINSSSSSGSPTPADFIINGCHHIHTVELPTAIAIHNGLHAIVAAYCQPLPHHQPS